MEKRESVGFEGGSLGLFDLGDDDPVIGFKHLEFIIAIVAAMVAAIAEHERAECRVPRQRQ